MARLAKPAAAAAQLAKQLGAGGEVAGRRLVDPTQLGCERPRSRLAPHDRLDPGARRGLVARAPRSPPGENVRAPSRPMPGQRSPSAAHASGRGDHARPKRVGHALARLDRLDRAAAIVREKHAVARPAARSGSRGRRRVVSSACETSRQSRSSAGGDRALLLFAHPNESRCAAAAVPACGARERESAAIPAGRGRFAHAAACSPELPRVTASAANASSKNGAAGDPPHPRGHGRRRSRRFVASRPLCPRLPRPSGRNGSNGARVARTASTQSGSVPPIRSSGTGIGLDARSVRRRAAVRHVTQAAADALGVSGFVGTAKSLVDLFALRVSLAPCARALLRAFRSCAPRSARASSTWRDTAA